MVYIRQSWAEAPNCESNYDKQSLTDMVEQQLI